MFSAFIAIPLLAALVLWLVPRECAALRFGIVLYAALALALFVIDNPLGGNVTRLGSPVRRPGAGAGALAARSLVVLAVAIPLLYWQWWRPSATSPRPPAIPRPSAAFYEPLLAELDARDGSAEIRVQVPPTQNRWEAVYVARERPLARGWLRQLESDDFDLFTEGRLTPQAYASGSTSTPSASSPSPRRRRDYLAEDEVALIDSGLPT